jgi:hypothetical protein
MSSIHQLSVQQLRQAANLKEKIDALEKELSQVLGSTAKPAGVAAPKKRLKMSASARAKISAAAKARCQSKSDKAGSQSSQACQKEIQNECGGQGQTVSLGQGSLGKNQSRGKEIIVTYLDSDQESSPAFGETAFFV